MWLVSLQMRGSVARNEIFSLQWRYYGPKGVFWTIDNYILLMDKKIWFERMDIGNISLTNWHQWNVQI